MRKFVWCQLQEINLVMFINFSTLDVFSIKFSTYNLIYTLVQIYTKGTPYMETTARQTMVKKMCVATGGCQEWAVPALPT